MGFKPVENRTWYTSYRGPVLIHAGKKEEVEDVDGVLESIADQTGEDLSIIQRGYRNHRYLGGIVGAATLVKCVTHHESSWFNGPYGFVFENPTWTCGVPCRGELGFFNVPDEVISLLHIPPYIDCLDSK